MANYSGKSNSGEKTDVRVVIAGDQGTGKTSLILAVQNEDFGEQVVPVLPITRLADNVCPDHVPVTIVDTSSRVSLEELASPLMQMFQEIESCIECSARNLIQVSEVFHSAQRAVVHPIDPLFDQQTQTLKPQCVMALQHIFQICDQDQDGSLSDTDLNDFQVKCFGVPLAHSEIVGIKRVVQEKLSEGVNDRGLTLTGFLFLHALFIEKGRIETTWTVLRKFGYDREVKHLDDRVSVSYERVCDQIITKDPSRLDNTKSEVEAYLSTFGPKTFSLTDLQKLTSNFSESNVVGFGGYGKVYRGQLPSGLQVAVKVLASMDVAEETFMAEVGTMEASHRNLIKLYGYCFEPEMKALVYEYMVNGSLDKILYESGSSIEWEKLYNIAIEVAKALVYLHDGLEKRMIHYDIKASNVLLDKNHSPKITDFGMAKFVKRDVSHVALTRIKGTEGYNAPETWIPGSQVTYKCDVFSFGMMLFEVLGRRKNGTGENWFPGHVWEKCKAGQLDHMIEECGITSKDRENAKLLALVALWCAQFIPEKRPTMPEVVLMLERRIPVEKPPPPFPFWQPSYS
ncbi:hypothetical protein AQUCO_07800030v1 [Aquilegia coerulea]|uniref:non-specific serine/threonine protein kinase n=1 Tax=Aquilegia coerulea TaxID=218851 RepID=A0A2G5C829_AQUCA|nr:hypothetical protein AQUCO_07800030v1 [Aquilegia coerulea]